MRRVRTWLSPGVAYEPGPEASAPRCGRCRYPVPGGSQGAACECPECGARVDPRDSSTLARPSAIKVQRRLVHAPGPLECAIAAVPGLLACAGASVPQGYFGLIILSIAATMAVLGWWLLRVFIATVIGWRWERMAAVVRQPGWIVMPAALVATGALSFTSIPARFVLWGEVGSLDAAVRLARATEAAGGDDAALAAITVDFSILPGIGRVAPEAMGQLREWCRTHRTDGDVDWTRGGVAVTVPGTGFLFEVGSYFFLPALEPQPGDEPIPTTILSPLGGGWYAGRLDLDR